MCEEWDKPVARICWLHDENSLWEPVVTQFSPIFLTQNNAPLLQFLQFS
jgi:hypothetical protein